MDNRNNRPGYSIDDLHWIAAMIEMDRKEAALRTINARRNAKGN